MNIECFVGTVDQIAAARRFVGEVVGDGHPRRAEAVLLASEIAANAVEHTATGHRPDGGAGGFTVIVVHDAAWVYVQVVDEGARSVPCACKTRLDGESGRGVALIRELAWQWGYTSRRLGDRERGVVWFVLGQPYGRQVQPYALNGHPRLRG